MEKLLIVIDNEVTEITEAFDNGYNGTTITCDNGCEYIIFQDHEEAGEAAAEYWRDMAKNDPEEFKCMVGNESLVAWCLGQSAGPGAIKVNSLEEWFETCLDVPEVQWAGYDGHEITDITFNRHTKSELGYNHKEAVLYRSN